jgi:hypothetical protein
LEARPSLEQDLVGELDTLGRIVNRHQQPGLDKMIAQSD